MKSQKKLQRLALFATIMGSTMGAMMFQGLTLAVYAAPETAKRADAFVDSIGINVHLNYTNTAYGNYRSIIKPRLQELGIRHIRDGGYKTPEFLNQIKELGKLGIKSTLYFADSPAQVVATAKTLQGALVAVESINEYDLTWLHPVVEYNGRPFPQGVRDYHNALYAAIKGDSATAYLPVLMPSMGWGENAQRLGYLENGDFGNMHSYPNLGNPPTDALDWYFIYHARTIAGNIKPLLSTETGYHTLTSHPLGVSETVAGKYIPRLLLENFNRDVRRVYLYELIDQFLDPGNSDEQRHYGLLRNDGSPKPAYTTIKNLIALLGEPPANTLLSTGGTPATTLLFNPGNLDYTLSGNTTDVHHTLLQKSNGVFYLVLWQEVRSWDNQNKNDIAVGNREVTLNLNTAIRYANVYQPLISTNPTQSTKTSMRLNTLTLSVPDHPLIVELSI